MRVGFVDPAEHESLVDLLGELYAYYHDSKAVAPSLVRAHLHENLLAPGAPIRLVVASPTDGAVVGFAAIALLHSLVDPTPENRKQCLLKELFVTAQARSQGVGRSLVAWVAHHALEQGCCRIDWPVQASNRAGIAFYERLGAERVAERLSYRLAASGLLELAREGMNDALGR